jgi:peptide methionine sulfoxide reductase msrA/msrB
MAFKTASLNQTILAVVKDKGTERPETGEYNHFDESGTYLCRQCGVALFHSNSKFYSGCGWPSFDSEIKNTILRETDADKMRTEILCARCMAHLGHVFSGEGYTANNIRHCVNSLSLDFVPVMQIEDTEEAIFAAGCFWGVEYYLKQLKGVLKTEVGYTGGQFPHPTYENVCSGTTGHYEAIRVVYDPNKITYTELTKYFFEIHDPTQTNGQGPDQGQQYLSAIFYYDATQEVIAQKLIAELQKRQYKIATQLLPVSVFWPAEKYHQDYYQKTAKKPYCHRYERKFIDS